MDELDVVAEVGGVGADPAAGGAPHVGAARQSGAGARVTAGVSLMILVTVLVTPGVWLTPDQVPLTLRAGGAQVQRLSLNKRLRLEGRGLGRGGGVARDAGQGENCWLGHRGLNHRNHLYCAWKHGFI